MRRVATDQEIVDALKAAIASGAAKPLEMEEQGRKVEYHNLKDMQAALTAAEARVAASGASNHGFRLTHVNLGSARR